MGQRLIRLQVNDPYPIVLSRIAAQVLLNRHFVDEQPGALHIDVYRHGAHKLSVARQVKALDLLALVQVNHGNAFGQVIDDISELRLGRIRRDIERRPASLKGDILDHRVRFGIDDDQIVGMRTGQEIPFGQVVCGRTSSPNTRSTLPSSLFFRAQPAPSTRRGCSSRRVGLGKTTSRLRQSS